ncbi:MAG: nitroreductase [Bacteroides sp.]|nr:nitroreductase [Bacteroides sp.]
MIVASLLHAQNPDLSPACDTDLMFMVENAIQAPSGHNTQPWLFRLAENQIEIHPNYEKALPVADTHHRELFISLGCALENLCLAASVKGYQTETTIGEDGVIRIELSATSQPQTGHPLFAQIPVRQTNRSTYTHRRIEADTLDLLQQVSAEERVQIRFYENGTAEFDTLRSYVEQGNRLQMRDEAFKKELKEWMRYNRKQTLATRDGLSYQVFGAPNLPLCISRPVIHTAINERSQVKADNRKIASASHFVLFTTQNHTIAEWVGLGRTLQRFLLTATELGIVHSYFNQPNEIAELSACMAHALNLTEEYPNILLRIGYGERMSCSHRKKAEEVILKE